MGVALDKQNWVWHYTQKDTLPLILDSHTIWLTSVQNLNDSAEVVLGQRRMKRVLRTFRHYHPDDPWSSEDIERLKEFRRDTEGIGFDGSAFVLSCSKRGDDNAQWDRYAKWDGFAIALPEGVHMPVLGEDPPTPPAGYIEEFPLRWVDLAYKKRDQVRVAEAGWGRVMGQLRQEDSAPRDWDYGDFFHDRAISEFVEAVAAIKSKGYESEREVRYVVKYPDNPSSVYTRRSSFEGQTDAKYVKITGLDGDRFREVGHDSTYHQKSASRLPIVAVRCGPHQDFKVAERALRPLLDGAGYTDVKILKSKSTQRKLPPTGR